jgi:hypothetical protein
MQAASHFNAFGAPCVPPRELTRLERIGLLSEAAGSLQAGKIQKYTGLWLGQAIAAWLETGESLESLLGVKPARGCKLSVAKITHMQRCNTALLQLSTLVGGDREAARVLAGKSVCPTRAQPLVDRIRTLKAPTSQAAITRARGAK